MNKFIASAGLVVLGAAGVQGQSFYDPAPQLTSKERAKPWSVSAVLRGFYDDNVLATPKDAIQDEADSFGIEVGPNVGLHMTGEQTYLSLEAGYRYVWYAENELEDDQKFLIDLAINHSFTDRARLRISDSFVRSREPEVTSTVVTAPTRIDQSVLYNRAGIGFDYDFTDLFSASFDYGNMIYDYSDDQWEPVLNRLEHDITGLGRWKVQPDLAALFGYTYSYVDFYGDGFIAPGVDPDTRNRSEHKLFVGVDTTIVENLTAGARVGVEIVDYPNSLPGMEDSEVGPYVDLHGRYTYLEGSYIYLGVKVETSTTDIQVAQDQETYTIYGGWSHQITPDLTAGLNGQAQFGKLRSPVAGVDDEDNDLYRVGADLNYKINEFWSANLGYSYTELDSGIPVRSFDRNQVFLGVTATY